MNRWFGKAERDIPGVRLAGTQREKWFTKKNGRRNGENEKTFVLHPKPLYFFRSAVFGATLRLEEASD